jgi:hypothetical protein
MSRVRLLFLRLGARHQRVRGRTEVARTGTAPIEQTPAGRLARNHVRCASSFSLSIFFRKRPDERVISSQVAFRSKKKFSRCVRSGEEEKSVRLDLLLVFSPFFSDPFARRTKKRLIPDLTRSIDRIYRPSFVPASFISTYPMIGS